MSIPEGTRRDYAVGCWAYVCRSGPFSDSRVCRACPGVVLGSQGVSSGTCNQYGPAEAKAGDEGRI